MGGLNVEKARAQFPALNQVIEGVTPVFFDGPGGTQAPQSVLDAVTGYLKTGNSNMFDSPFFAVQNTHKTVAEARKNAGTFVNAPRPEDIIFGATMSALTLHLSRSIALEWEEGDEIIVTDLDHFSNVSFWRKAAQERGAICHVAKIKADDCTLDYDHLESLISPKTKFIAFTLASNVCGSRTDAQRIIAAAKAVGALTYCDSVHAAPHYLPDVQALDCDFLACSVYKFYGPHLGFVYGKQEHFERLVPYKIEPAPSESPECWEVGTKSFEALSGLSATINYMGSFNDNNNLRGSLKSFYKDLYGYEQDWSRKFLQGAQDVAGIKIHGITDMDRLAERSPTFAFTIDGHAPKDISAHLAKFQISCGSGMFYANGLMDTLGLSDKGGIVRAGCVHYNTFDEIDRLFDALKTL